MLEVSHGVIREIAIYDEALSVQCHCIARQRDHSLHERLSVGGRVKHHYVTARWILTSRQAHQSKRNTQPEDMLIDQEAIALENRRIRSEEHTSELQSQSNLVCRLL